MYTNVTPNLKLPQWTANEKPSYLGDMNTAFSIIDENVTESKTLASNAERTATAASTSVSNITDLVGENTTDITQMKQTILAQQTLLNNLNTQIDQAIIKPIPASMISGLGNYLSDNNPNSTNNTVMFRIISIFDLKLLNIYGNYRVEYTGTPTTTELLNFNEILISSNLKAQLDAITSGRVFYNICSAYIPNNEGRSESTLLIYNQETNKISRITTPQFTPKANAYISLDFQALLVL